jgi:hypothetical protein
MRIGDQLLKFFKRAYTNEQEPATRAFRPSAPVLRPSAVSVHVVKCHLLLDPDSKLDFHSALRNSGHVTHFGFVRSIRRKLSNLKVRILFYEPSESSRLAQILEHLKFGSSDLRFGISLWQKAALFSFRPGSKKGLGPLPERPGGCVAQRCLTTF